MDKPSQYIWLHGRDCYHCQEDSEESKVTNYMIFDGEEGFGDFEFPDGILDHITVQDQHGRTYNIRRIT